ncbi:DUF4119 family protein [Bacteroides caecimuris]|uniref:Uncharacterized protein n=1 Tax=Bacteroides caecimuris TaxID=1796613 RepID=A0A1C7H138_9BACE|nr:DUF4119 family protein [Bacteroides caecimuris]ANU57706.1 hypothetical protein A4V03_09100 [Bacteroides caecimuris]NDO59792.1 hypothetical protein [Bacteroides caecimuris]OXE62244.1 hypothetical protein ADH74_16385 [Bacteroides caecimuris]QQR17425.1 DUF4119 family protein [Bacteroides caecimuris]UQA30406.1 DUF4119 domain-containing protein [Bacteroides caecimuris]
MKRKKAEKESKNNKVKRNTQTRKRGSRIQHKEEIISEEEMERRNGISGDTILYLTMFLKLFFYGFFFCQKPRKLISLALFIHRQEILYIRKRGGYKLMEFSSIHTELAALKKTVEKQCEEEIMEKRKKAEKFKSRY